MTSKPHWLIRKQVRIWIAQLHHVGASFVSLAPTYFISQSALTPLLLLSNCDPLCWARSWWAALRAAFFVSDTNIGFNRPCHVGASFVSLAPTYFISQGTLVLLSFLSHCIPLRRARSGRGRPAGGIPRLSHQEGRYLRPQMPPFLRGPMSSSGRIPALPSKNAREPCTGGAK